MFRVSFLWLRSHCKCTTVIGMGNIFNSGQPEQLVQNIDWGAKACDDAGEAKVERDWRHTAKVSALRGNLMGGLANSQLNRATSTREMESVVKQMEGSIDELGAMASNLRDRLGPVLVHDAVDTTRPSPPPQCQSDMGRWIESRDEMLQNIIVTLRNITERLAL